MKNILTLSLLVPTFMLAACGSGSGNNAGKDPVPELAELRERAKLELKNGPQVPPERIKYVEKEVAVKQEQTTLTDSFVKITYPSQINFYEGETGKVKITLSVKDSGFTMKLTAKGLPKGAEFKDISTKSEPGTYEFSWKPAFNTLPQDQNTPEAMAITLVPELNTAKDAAKAQAVRALSLEKTLVFHLMKSQEKPSALTITNIPAEVKAGEKISFSAEVKFPGLDNTTAFKPEIARIVEKDVAANGTLLVEGVEYIGDFKWKFTLNFTPDVNATQARLVLKAYGAINVSKPTVITLKIKAQEVAPSETAAPSPTATPAAGGK